MKMTCSLVEDDSESSVGALLLLGSDIKEVDRFFVALTETMFPPGERASSTFIIESGQKSFLLYEVRSRGGSVQVLLENLPADLPGFIRRTMIKRGSLLFLFGAEAEGERILLEPSGNHLVRTSVMIDGEWIDGTGGSTWQEFLQDADRRFSHVRSTT